MRINTLILTAIAGLALTSCNKFDDLNDNPKAAAKVPAETLFSNAQVNLMDQISSPNVNINNFRLWSQYWNETTYNDESNYNIERRQVADNAWQAYYRDVLSDLEEARRLIENEGAGTPSDNNKLAIIELHKVYVYLRLVDLFGNIPYSEALDINTVLPKYDDAKTVYTDLISRARTARDNLDPSAGSFGSSDLIYGGDAGLWKTFANSLLLKIGIHVADLSDMNPGEIVSKAVDAGVFQSMEESATMDFLGSAPYTNPIYEALILSGRKDYVAANTIVDKMNQLEDPRREYYFSDNIVYNDTTITGSDTTITPTDSVIYVGGEYGTKSGYPAHTHVSPQFRTPTYPGFLLTYTEVQFYLAEAVEHKFITMGTAKDYYNEGIRSSFMRWGNTEDEADDYLGNPDVAYSTAEGEWRQKIGTQAWIAFYNQPFVGWTEWRRLDYPLFNPPLDLQYTDIPTRYAYPINEQTLNGANYTQAASAIGGDSKTTLLFWDIEQGPPE